MSRGPSWHKPSCHVGQVSIGQVGTGPIDSGQIVLTPYIYYYEGIRAEQVF